MLGIDAGKDVSEQDIARVASEEKKERLTLRKGDSILLIQSGATIPDKEMNERMEKYFSVSVFTGVPESGKKENASYARALRYAAAKAGIERIVVYSGRFRVWTKEPCDWSWFWVGPDCWRGRS